MSQLLKSEDNQDQSIKNEVELLVEAIIEYMPAYLLNGFVDPNVTKGFDVSGARALEFSTALKIRFLLDEEVVGFLRILETYLRRTKTVVSREKDLSKEIRGHIDWERTFQNWAISGYKDKTIFAIDKPIKNYDIPENLILKKIVSILHQMICDNNVGKEIDRDYSWSKQLQERRQLINCALRNVHFKKIMDERKITITSRMKSQVRKSRKQLYRDSCRIFEKYENVFLRHEFDQLLKDTFINPNNLEKTFEIFCLFTIIDTLIEMGWNIEKLFEITRERNETAVLKNPKKDCKINVFYNVTNTLEFYSRSEPKVIENALKEITKSYFNEEKLTTTRRPDIILEFIDENDHRDFIVIEVKYTKSHDYVIEGIYQALHYLYDLKLKGTTNQFFYGEKMLGKGYNGAVMSFKLPSSTEKRKIEALEDKTLKVKLFEFNDLIKREPLKRFFEKYSLQSFQG